MLTSYHKQSRRNSFPSCPPKPVCISLEEQKEIFLNINKLFGCTIPKHRSSLNSTGIVSACGEVLSNNDELAHVRKKIVPVSVKVWASRRWTVLWLAALFCEWRRKQRYQLNHDKIPDISSRTRGFDEKSGAASWCGHFSRSFMNRSLSLWKKTWRSHFRKLIKNICFSFFNRLAVETRQEGYKWLTKYVFCVIKNIIILSTVLVK